LADTVAGVVVDVVVDVEIGAVAGAGWQSSRRATRIQSRYPEIEDWRIISGS